MANNHIVIAENGASSGLSRTYTLQESIFYASQDTVVLDWNCHKAYGTTSFINKSYLVSMFYQPNDLDGNPIADPMIIGGYVSPWNIPVFGEFYTDALRIGVKYSAVKEAIQDRIDFAENLINAGGSGDESRFGTEAFLQQSVKILQSRLKMIEKVIDKGVQICILCEAARSINYRKTEILDYVVFNQGFFDTYYPETAFPIGSPFQFSKKNSWITRDYFVPALFKLQKDPITIVNGIINCIPAHRWSLSPINNSKDNWKVKLEIIFQRIPTLKKKSKPTDNPLPPKSAQVLPADIAKKNAIDAVTSGAGEVSPTDYNEATKVEKSLEKGAKELDKAKKDQQVTKYREYADDLRTKLVGVMVTEAEKVTKTVEDVDIFGRDFEEVMDNALSTLEDFGKLELSGELSGKDFERSYGKLSDAISETYHKRAEELAKAHKDIDVDSTDLEGSEQEVIGNRVRAQLTGDSDASSTFDIVGEKRKERAQKKLDNWQQMNRNNPDFFKIPPSILEDAAQTEIAGLSGNENWVNEVSSTIQNKIINEMREEMNSSGPDKIKLDKLFNIACQLPVSLPNDIVSYFSDKHKLSNPSELIGFGVAPLSGKGNAQKIE